MVKERTTAKLANLFRRGREKKEQRLALTGPAASFSTFSGDPYSNDVYRSGVDAIARVAAKFVLTPTITFSDGSTTDADDRLAHLLQVEPNPLMTSFDLQYQMYTHLYLHNNAYVYIHRDDSGRVIGLYPVHVSHCDFEQDSEGNVYCDFTFANGKRYTIPYSDVIHLRRHFNADDVAGDPNDAIEAGVELADVQNQGITQGIKTGASIRGIVRFTQILSPEKLKAQKEAFVRDYLSLENSGGIAAVDTSMEYTPLESKPVTISAEDQAATRSKINSYLGINNDLVDSTFTDEEFGAFEESVVEALALQTSLEFTRKVYSEAQVRRGRRIDCRTSRINFMSNERKVELIKTAVPMGIITVNQALDLIGLPAMADDRRLQSLNYVSAEIADRYQLYKSGNGVKSLDDGSEGGTEGQEEGDE